MKETFLSFLHLNYSSSNFSLRSKTQKNLSISVHTHKWDILFLSCGWVRQTLQDTHVFLPQKKMVARACSRTPRATRRNPVLKSHTNEQTKQQQQQKGNGTELSFLILMIIYHFQNYVRGNQPTSPTTIRISSLTFHVVNFVLDILIACTLNNLYIPIRQLIQKKFYYSSNSIRNFCSAFFYSLINQKWSG